MALSRSPGPRLSRWTMVRTYSVADSTLIGGISFLDFGNMLLAASRYVWTVANDRREATQMVFRRIDALASDVMRRIEIERAAAENGAPEGEKTDAETSELPGVEGGQLPRGSVNNDAAPGGKKSRSGDQWIVRPPTVKRGRIRPTASAAPALGVRPRFAANDNHSADSFSGAGR